MPKLKKETKTKKLWHVYARIQNVSKSKYQKAIKKAGFRSQQQHIASVVEDLIRN